MIESFVISVSIGLIHYYVLNDSVIAIIIGGLNFYLWTLFILGFKKINQQYFILYQMYFLMHSVITTLAIKRQVHESIWDVLTQLIIKHPTLEQSIGTDGVASLVNLKTTYPYKIYALFVASLQFFDQQGGEVMEIFDNFLRQARISESRIQEEQQHYQQGLIEFSTLWIFNLLVLLLSKWALRYVYDSILNNLWVIILISLVFTWLPITFMFYQKRYQMYSFIREQS